MGNFHAVQEQTGQQLHENLCVKKVDNAPASNHPLDNIMHTTTYEPFYHNEANNLFGET